MTFYYRPPSGEVGLDVVRRATFVRLRFLIEVVKCRRRLDDFRTLIVHPFFVKNANYLMEGTSLDCMSHFLLSLLTVGNRQSFIFIRNAELQLFEFRLRLNSKTELTKAMKKVSHFVLKRIKLDIEMIEIFTRLNDFGHRKFVDCVKNPSDFQSSSIVVPFTSVLQLVAERRVNLINGFASVPADSMKIVLLHIFDKFLTNNSFDLRKSQSDLLSRDRRLSQLADELHGFLRFPVNDESESELTADTIEKFVHWFPPCMLHVHKQLKKKHRLKHHARIQYTLFLKELGMPLREAVKFWSHEYSQHASTNGDYNWNREFKRYGYNLRHLYGLEGAKISYSAHCCRSLQKKIVSFGDDAGCPFRHFDEKNLRIFLAKEYGLIDSQAWNDVKRVIDEEKSYCKACESVLCSISERKRKTTENVQFLSQPACQIGSQTSKRLYSSQPATFSKIFLPQSKCYEHELCFEDDESSNNLNIKKPSDFYKLMKV